MPSRWRCGTVLGSMHRCSGSLTDSWSWAGGGACTPGGTQQCVLSGCRVPCHVVSAGASSRVSQEGTPLHPLSLGCELSSSIRAERWAGRVLGGPLFAWQPLLRQRLGEKRRPGAAQPHSGDQEAVNTMAWTHLLLVFLSLYTGRHRPRAPGLSPSLISPWGTDSGNLSCSSCPVSPVSVSAGSLSQPVLTQPVTLSASRGASARLSCTLSSGYNVSNYSIYWYQQKAGSPPRYLLRFKSDSDKHQGSGVPSRFSGSKDASTNAGLLLISGLQPEDEADYYCAVWHGDTSAYTAPDQ